MKARHRAGWGVAGKCVVGQVGTRHVGVLWDGLG